MCLLSNDIYDYYNVAQGKITIPNVDDGEECLLTDVSCPTWHDFPEIPQASISTHHQLESIFDTPQRNEAVWNSSAWISSNWNTNQKTSVENRTLRSPATENLSIE